MGNTLPVCGWRKKSGGTAIVRSLPSNMWMWVLGLMRPVTESEWTTPQGRSEPSGPRIGIKKRFREIIVCLHLCHSHNLSLFFKFACRVAHITATFNLFGINEKYVFFIILIL